MNRRHLLQATAALAAAYALPLRHAVVRAASAAQASAESPSLLLNAEGIAALKARIATEGFAKAQWEGATAGVAKAMESPIELPPRGGNWSHNYVCPVHGARLKQGKKIGPWQWEHHCPIGPHTLLGDPSKATLDFDGNAIMAIHLQNAELLVNCGLVHQVIGEDGCAAYGRNLLLAYAAKYLTYPLHDNKEWAGKGAHVASQPLSEASWLLIMAQGADLLWATLSGEERKAAADKLFYPAVNDILLPSKLTIHNIQCRINSAIGLVGFLLKDKKLVEIAIDDPGHGFRQQIERGIHTDGMWLEGASGYHFFTIEGLWPLAEAARNNGIDLYSEKFKSMFDGPLRLARPDNVLPDFNDSGDTPLAGHADLYELALARFKDPRYAAVIREAGKGETEDEGPRSMGPRRNRMAMLFGVTPLPAAVLTPRGSENDTASGYAILQRGTDVNATWLCIKYGPHGGGHGHPDKNHFILYTRKLVLAPDAGTHAYGSPLHAGWDKTTLAHNTLTVDEKSQAPAEGRSLAFGTEKGVDYSITDAGPIYPGVQFVRTAALVDENLVVFIDQIAAEAEHTYDLAYHQAGTWKELPAGQKWEAPKKDGYSHFSETSMRSTADGMTLTTASAILPAAKIVLAPGPETQVITGNGVLKTTADLVPMVLLRRKARETTYVWALSIDGAALTLKTLVMASPGAAAVTVRRGERAWTLVSNPRMQAVQVGDQRVSSAFAVL